MDTMEVSQKIKDFLTKEVKNLSLDFPYRLDLYKNGKIDENKAGIRISETAQQFDDLGLTGLFFYYKLYDHSMRVPHWHANAVEVGVVLNGKMKITIWDGLGEPEVFTVEKNGTWLIPQASLHALENVGDSELVFFVAYNSPNAADRDFATAWAALPDIMLEKSLGLLPDEITTLKSTTKNRLSHYDPESIPERKNISSPFSNNFSWVEPLYDSALGSIRRVDESNTPLMKNMALQQTILNAGSMREPHWYTAGDTLLFVNKGAAFFTMMDDEGKVYNSMLEPGNLVFIPMGVFHSYVNVTPDVLEIYEAFNASKGLAEVTLLSGTQHFHVGTMASATGLSKDVINKVHNKPRQNYMVAF
jgi:oxalate decarboxylase/phosphoglucose isomerase-like protein (cupin superfamily)